MPLKFFRQPALIFSMGVALTLAATESPLWMTLFAVFICLWKWLHEEWGLKRLPRKMTGALSVVLLVQVYLQYRSVFGQEASNTLLLGMAALKVMDYENQRDHKFLVMLGFIMISMKSIFSIDLYWLVPSFLAFSSLWWSLLPSEFQKPFGFLSKLFLYSMPLMALLFFAFPRLVVPWALSRSQPVHQAGFSDQLDPGGVAELASLDQLAFRAKFKTWQVTSDSLYWRGSVLTQSEGMKWTPPRRREEGELPKSEGSEIEYEVILEPGSQGYIFSLDRVSKILSADTTVSVYAHSVLRTFRYLRQAQSYRLLSDDSTRDDGAPTEDLLQTPALSEKVRAWVDEIKRNHSAPKERLLALRQLFSDSSFVYTLKPGAYGEHDLEEFLFERRRGFCEHFAGSYATLARALDIPARVVIGYQGGVYNVFGDFWRISQRDAHAWVEVFNDGRWMRVDPTAWVAPLRLHLGAQDFFGLSEADQLKFARSNAWRAPGGSGLEVWEAITLWVDDVNYRWTYFLLDFDLESQRDLWRGLVQDFGRTLLFLLALLFCYLLWQRRRSTSSQSQIERLMDRVSIWSERKGLKRLSSTPPLTHLRTLERAMPEHGAEIQRVAELYDRSVYGNQEVNAQDMKVSRFKFLNT